MSTEHNEAVEQETAPKAAEETESRQEDGADAPELDGEQSGEAAGEGAGLLEELQKQVEEGQQRYLRAQADFDNFRRRTIKEKEELAQYASAKLIGQLLPIVDNFERAIAAAETGSDLESFTKGVEMIFRQLNQSLEGEGLKVMETVGQPFNPEFHQAIMQVESDEHEEGIVVEEVQKGYMLKEKVIRPAMVKVSG
ncbi:nucleotide exchange factor GrpE [Paenibacillus sp. CAU 1782]